MHNPTVFWLDAHYSRGGAPSAKGKYDPPLMFELSSILALGDPRHVVLIDDARCCGAEPGWPTLEEIERAVADAQLGLAVDSGGHHPDFASAAIDRAAIAALSGEHVRITAQLAGKRRGRCASLSRGPPSRRPGSYFWDRRL